MTCPRDPGSVEDLLLYALRVLSPSEIKAATGKWSEAFRKVSNPNNDYQLGIEDAAKLDGALRGRGREAVFIQWYYRQLEDVAFRDPRGPVERHLDFAGHSGKAALAVCEADSDGIWTPEEHKAAAAKYDRASRQALDNRDWHLEQANIALFANTKKETG